MHESNLTGKIPHRELLCYNQTRESFKSGSNAQINHHHQVNWKRQLMIKMFSIAAIGIFLLFHSANADIFSETIQLPGRGWHEVAARTVPSRISFLLFQVHNQRYNVTMSYDNYSNLLSSNTSSLPYGQYITGKDVGLVKTLANLPSNQTEYREISMWISNPNNFTVTATVIVSAHESNEPIPGGCNMEFPVEISPFLQLITDPSGTKVTIEFQHARAPAMTPPKNPYGGPLGLSRLVVPGCDLSFYLVTYEIYAYYLAENDYTEAEYRRALVLMSNATEILQHATKVKSYDIGPRTRTFFMAYPGRGVVYNVLASVGSNGPIKEPYVPIATYGCDFFSTVDGCGRLNSIVGKIFVTILGFWGLVVCLRGHQWFTTQMAFFGFLASSIPTFILVTKYTALYPDERDIIMTIMGIVGAVTWVTLWRLTAASQVMVVLDGFVLGFLTSAGILFTRLGNEEVFRRDVNYWLLMTCGILIVPILLLPFGIIISVFSSAIVGSYTAILAVDRFIGGSVSYIVLNVFKRAIYEDIYMASNQVPLQAKDEILLGAWGILSLIGIALQIYASLGSSAYPTPSRLTCWGGARSARFGRGRGRINLFVSSTGLGPADDNQETGLRGSSSDLEGSDQHVWRISEVRKKGQRSKHNSGQHQRQPYDSNSQVPVEAADEHSPLLLGAISAPRSGPSGTNFGTPKSRNGTKVRGRSPRTSKSKSTSTSTATAPPSDATIIYPDYGGHYGAVGS